MAVIAVTAWQINPGRGQQFISNVVEAKKIHERLGARVRVVQGGPGPRPGAVTYLLEFDDMVKYGEFVQKMAADAEWQAFWTRAQSDPSGEILEQGLAQDLPLP